MKHQKKQFAICVRNEGAEDLEIRKVYQILPDARAAKEKHVRVIDESGEDYLYPAEFFIPLTLPRDVERAFRLRHVKAARSANHWVETAALSAVHPKR